MAGSGSSGLSHSSETGCHCAICTSAVMSRCLGELGHQVRDALGLIARARVTEDQRAVDGDDDAVMKGVPKVVLELVGVELLGQPPGHPVVVNIDPYAPVVAHGPEQ